MCFSIQASIITSATLITMSTLYLKKQLRSATRMIALMPLLLGIQQACEAFIWHYKPIKKYAHLAHKATYIFLFFAYIVWPIWVPLALWHAESQVPRKQLLLILITIGVLTSTALGYCILKSTATSAISCAHIVYNTHIPTTWQRPLTYAYTIATIIPWFVSSIQNIWMIGILASIGYIVSAWYYFNAFTSVWCFFAAAISALIYIILDTNTQTT